MNELDPEIKLSQLFIHLHNEGFNLGIGEYLAAKEALRGGWGGSELGDTLKLLWCKTREQQVQFETIWESLTPQSNKPLPKSETLNNPSPKKPSDFKKESSPLASPQTPNPVPLQPAPSKLSPLPVQAPMTTAAQQQAEEITEIQNYWPVSRRSMIYTWRYLRRPEPDGPQDVLDIETTVEQTAQQGFFLAPVYQRRECNHAHLLLLVDQNGSMVPFHRFTRDLVETALYESTIQNVGVFYFRNVPASVVYRDAHMTLPIFLKDVLAECDSDTSVLIVSDAGAARGYSRWERIRPTTDVLFKIRQWTNLIAWLNPMPKDRWEDTSAKMIALLVPMFPMDREGLSNAIDIVRGQPLQSYL
ncbi:VWA containing CoxE family protein [Scytonema hofmannii PCC 7110]|uniref:VWA containing CoxE family protein n=1 Tax=Scytonema hofmannii PCC 7110 TaxID=128403 RepID=A0A139WT60_9CYAN|nr:hypothetical protein [Scytonema hofmannii]KYC35635.1 VWA containing CoxE family protein [Scytonema hofmannii PCC 7110]